jgi:hypothetical protein
MTSKVKVEVKAGTDTKHIRNVNNRIVGIEGARG